MRHLTGVRETNRVRAFAASGAMMLALAGLVACSESAGPEAGEVATEELTALQEQVTALEDRVGAAEGDMAAEGTAEDQPEVVGQL